MTSMNTVSRSLHDTGLAAWFGGTLANAIALNTAAGAASSASDTGAVANAGWDRWTPVNAAAIGAHLVGSLGQLYGNRGRVGAQSGVAAMSITKTALTAAALGVTAWARAEGKTVSAHEDVPVDDATSPRGETPPEVAAAQRKLTALQWVIPVLTGALVVISSVAGEQQRPQSVLAGVRKRLEG
jgi:hypothetical protein